ncbi:MAG: hypothetical protein O2968_21715 [Acidobacteria bacterium]|nr:hypothetical protein [Acidobacteriota bacterium]
MNVILTPELERLVQQKVANGEFASPEAVIEAAVRELASSPTPAVPLPTSEQRLANLQALFEEIDREPAQRTTPLPDDVFDRENLYDDRA